MKVRGVPRAARDAEVRRVAALLQLDALLDRRPHQLSGGQRQRVAMGRALVRNPKVFLFDEPLSNLDAKLRVEMRTELKKLHQNLGVTIVYVTHDQIEAMTLATKVVVMKGGAIQQIGDAAGDLRPAGQPVRRRLHRLAADEPDPRACWRRRTAARSSGSRARPTARSALVARAASCRRYQPIRGADRAARHPAGGDHARQRRWRADDATFEARIDVVEPTGADNLAFLTLGDSEVIARLPPGRSAAGERIRLQIDPERALIFDPKTERLVR